MSVDRRWLGPIVMVWASVASAGEMDPKTCEALAAGATARFEQGDTVKADEDEEQSCSEYAAAIQLQSAAARCWDVVGDKKRGAASRQLVARWNDAEGELCAVGLDPVTDCAKLMKK